jgi:hypothetical protein
MKHAIINDNETADERISADFNYEVEQVPLITPDGQQTRFFGTRRKDTGEVFATVTDRYELLQNSTLIGATEDLFRGRGLTGWNRKEVVSHGGARMRAIYDFPNIGGKVAGQDITFRLKVQNSFDGSLRASFAVGLFRLICSNGAVAPVNAVNLTKKHTASLDPSFIGGALDEAVKGFHDALPAFERMANIRVSQSEGKTILFNLADRKLMSERHAESINQVWESPTYSEDRSRNLWNLYNATTQYLTHTVEAGMGRKPRFELAERLNHTVAREFVRSARKGDAFDLLIKMN